MNQETRASSNEAKANEPPGLDIFCTPENSDFLSKVHYEDLNNTEREIRLLKILPDSGSGFVECELLPSVKLANVRKRYLALSYCAGDPRNTNAILVNGAKCNVFANLHHALMTVRYFWESRPQKKDLLLWVDQICINQVNLAERSHQVGFMKDIYQNAEETLVCLSVNETEGRGMQWLIQLEQYYIDHLLEKHLHETRISTEGSKDDSTFRSYGVITYLRDMINENDFADNWIEFFHVLKSPWWDRAWVFQEFIISARMTFLFGEHSISYSKMVPFLLGICTATLESICEPHVRRHQVFTRLVERSQYSTEEIEEAANKVYNMIMTKDEWIHRSDLEYLLVHNSNSQASDPRDKIYSVLGLAHPGYGIVPDYSPTNDLNKVLIETTRQIILHTDCLAVLIYLDHSAPHHNNAIGLPSWAVNWMVKINTYGYKSGNSILKSTGFMCHCIKDETADASFSQLAHPEEPGRITTALEVWGVCLDYNMQKWSSETIYKGLRDHTIIAERTFSSEEMH
ncbi:heterokaryon incompatibility 6 OR allele [Fusarium beomiforme]|uniref:Heterokaryon incompatibility 6 OR allele n=1 Tax=Fusarium beomiforme TaxID=44412 RepID=A0A9P5ARJ6_9HYPO|nr:heterokaryon incompatibility 6 OR allele [Fusarium beomiforme]